MKNFEIKINISNIIGVEKVLKKFGAVHKCDMHQTDYYFNLGTFKEKIREINNDKIQLISYNRTEICGKKESNYDIKDISQEEKNTLLNEKKVLCVVDKVRKLWIYKNTRIHLDSVMGLGDFLELETVIRDISAQRGIVEFKKVINLFKIDLQKSVACSYSDLILKNNGTRTSSFLINKFTNL